MDDRENGQNVLRAVAEETLGLLPHLLRQLQTTYQAETAEKLSSDSLHHLDPARCPRYPRPATIRVVNQDTLNAAIDMIRLARVHERDHKQPPLIVNFANEKKPGGGWLNGRIAQEEALCYRSSLARSLQKSLYPLLWDEVIYSPYVLVMRSDMRSGHAVLRTPPEELPVVSCITVAAKRNPKTRTFRVPDSPSGNEGYGGVRIFGMGYSSSRKLEVFESDKDRSIAKQKMRLTLRAAANRRHRLLVLGALGCGVYANPPEDVAHCWLEVLREHEFSGNWWREVWFAVFDPTNTGNFRIFDQVLTGQEV